MQEQVILIDQFDTQIGVAEKMDAHIKGILHRAFSVFIFNEKNELLLQQRAATKYHSPLLWTNTCCSHPRPRESVFDAARRRLIEEMGLECELVPQFEFMYRAELENGLIEHEYDHVLFGISSKNPVINLDEVHAWRYASFDVIEKEIKTTPESYTSWFKICFEEVKQRMQNKE